jgi:hypothetical protein
MKIVVRLATGYEVHFDAPETFDFVNFVEKIRASDFWLDAGGVYVPHGRIEAIYRADGRPPVGMPQGVTRQ